MSNSLQPQGAFEAPLSMGFPMQEHWSGLLFLSPGALPDPGIEAASPESAGRFFTLCHQGSPSEMGRDSCGSGVWLEDLGLTLQPDAQWFQYEKDYGNFYSLTEESHPKYLFSSHI